MDNQSLPRHPIRVVAQRTGLTPAAIRAWERRYQAVSPMRSEGKQRLYSDRDVERLRTLKALADAGRSIGTVAGLSDEAAERLLSEDRASAAEVAAPVRDYRALGVPFEWVDECYAQVQALDAEGLERTLWRSVVTLGGRVFLSDVVGGLLKRIGAGWVAGEISPGQEHLGSDVLDRVLQSLGERSPASDGPKLVVATLPGERHGLGARLVSVAAVIEGWNVMYLGTDLPVTDIAGTARAVGAAAVAISVVGSDKAHGTLVALGSLRELLEPGVDLLVGGGGAQKLPTDRIPTGIRVLDGLEGLEVRPTNRVGR